ncbi:saccharopine dehydrogenase family protein [Dactylosporangium sp. CA-052675]|uniref:saccharopine dehydrogenase family protein n=1 Tax=Dactylosporangium sp. CA-052675 TaxID=3239927 RepID=UPI003D9011EA
MRLLIVGAGGVGTAAVRIAARRPFLEHCVVADHDAARAEAAVSSVDDPRFAAAVLDAASAPAVAQLCRSLRITHVLNAVDPRFVVPIFTGALEARAHYVDLAMSLSQPHPERPYRQIGVLLGAEQFALEDRWRAADRLALVGMGVAPGLCDVFARYAADVLFAEVHDIGVRGGSDLVVDGYEFAPASSIWTTIEECLNPPLIYEKNRGLYVTRPFSEPEIFDFPAGIGPIECVHVEHEEVLLIPRWIDVRRVTFKAGLGDEFIQVLKTIRKLGLDSTRKVTVGGVAVSPRDVVAAVLPDPAKLGERMHGRTCAGTYVTGLGRDGRPRATYLYHVVDNAWTMREYGCQAVVWQTAVNAVVGLELLAAGTWTGTGVLGPEAFPPRPFLELLAEHGVPWSKQEL